MSTIQALEAVKQLLAPPSYTELPVLWERPHEGYPTLAGSGQLAPWVLAEMPFSTGITLPGQRGQRLRRKVGLLRAFILTPKFMGDTAGHAYTAALDDLIDCTKVPTGEPNRYVKFESAAIVSGRDLVRSLSDLADTFEPILVQATFTYFHR